VLCVACVEQPLRPAPPADPQLRIVYDWAMEHPASGEGFSLLIYPLGDTDTRTSPVMQLLSPFDAHVLPLPEGTYSLLAYTADAPGVEFLDVDNYAQARVSALDERGHSIRRSVRAVASADSVMLSAAGSVYSVWNDRFTSDHLSVSYGVRELHLPVNQLAAPVHLNIVDNTGQSAATVDGILQGLVLSRRLAGGDADLDDGMGAYKFRGEFGGDGQATLVVPCLGIHNPIDKESGERRYDNRLKLVVTFADGNQSTTELDTDISEQLASTIDHAAVSVELHIDIDISQDDDGYLQANFTIRPWDEVKQDYEMQ
jgi:hypothetical protein